MRLIHPETYRETQVAIRNCTVLSYSSIAMVGDVPLVRPPPSFDKCAFLFISEKSVVDQRLKMITIVHRRTKDTLSLSARKFSKIPKLLPHVFFGNRTPVFFDTKLVMKADLMALANLSRDTYLAAYRHPQCTPGCSPASWMQTEARLLKNSGRVGRMDFLRTQVRRYSAAMAPHTRCQTYIEGALLIQRNARAVFDAWSGEFLNRRTRTETRYPLPTSQPRTARISSS